MKHDDSTERGERSRNCTWTLIHNSGKTVAPADSLNFIHKAVFNPIRISESSDLKIPISNNGPIKLLSSRVSDAAAAESEDDKRSRGVAATQSRGIVKSSIKIRTSVYIGKLQVLVIVLGIIDLHCIRKACGRYSSGA
jgi:hypothetical protein